MFIFWVLYIRNVGTQKVENLKSVKCDSSYVTGILLDLWHKITSRNIEESYSLYVCKKRLFFKLLRS